MSAAAGIGFASVFWPLAIAPFSKITLPCSLSPRRRLTSTVFIRAERSVEGTKYPPRLATSPLRKSGARTSEGDGEEIRCEGDDTRWDGDDTRAEGEVALEREGALITCAIICVSTLCISIVSFGRRVVMYG